MQVPNSGKGYIDLFSICSDDSYHLIILCTILSNSSLECLSRVKNNLFSQVTEVVFRITWSLYKPFCLTSAAAPFIPKIVFAPARHPAGFEMQAADPTTRET